MVSNSNLFWLQEFIKVSAYTQLWKYPISSKFLSDFTIDWEKPTQSETWTDIFFLTFLDIKNVNNLSKIPWRIDLLFVLNLIE